MPKKSLMEENVYEIRRPTGFAHVAIARFIYTHKFFT
jgi:hypothetical protein